MYPNLAASEIQMIYIKLFVFSDLGSRVLAFGLGGGRSASVENPIECISLELKTSSPMSMIRLPASGVYFVDLYLVAKPDSLADSCAHP